jgi:hypothetical protein
MREAIRPKLRFQVFTRDEFTCQYCGRTPDQDDVVLQVDHTVSVKDGGTNDIENLITSCFECNIGKGAKSILKRTRTEQDIKEELDLAQERLAQIKALNKRKKSLAKVKDKISFQETQWARDITDGSLNLKIYTDIQKLRNKGTYTEDILKQALEITYNKHQKTEFETISKFMSYLQGVSRNISLSPEQQQIIMLYNRDIFTNERMYPQTRKMILDNSDFGLEFHEEVMMAILSSHANKNGKTFRTRDEVLGYYPNQTYTVYKSGLNLQILVCDTIVRIAEETFD